MQVWLANSFVEAGQALLNAPRPRGDALQHFEGFQFGGQSITTITPQQINQFGQVAFFIVGPDGVTEIWRATPVPEPSTGVLCMAGLFGLAWLWRRRRSTRFAD